MITLDKIGQRAKGEITCNKGEVLDDVGLNEKGQQFHTSHLKGKDGENEEGGGGEGEEGKRDNAPLLI